MKLIAILSAVFLAQIALGQTMPKAIQQRTHLILFTSEESTSILPAHQIREAIASSNRYLLVQPKTPGFAIVIHVSSLRQMNSVTFLYRFPNGSQNWIGNCLIPDSKQFGSLALAGLEDLMTDHSMFSDLIP